MKYLRFLLPFLITVGLVLALDRSMGIIPPLGRFLSPFEGFWRNARTGKEQPPTYYNMKGLKGPVTVYTDEHQVPHITASNNEDLYFMQGYVTARDRLWQMEFMTHAASGRISELIGEKGLNFDRTQRRLGLPYGAKQAIANIDNDPVAKMVLEQYAAGVNAYIKSLRSRDLPVEYKLMNYKPEEWTPYKTAVLLKFMAKMLTGHEEDFEMTNALNKFGREIFDELYPDYDGTDPIIPAGTKFDFTPVKIDTPANTIPKGQLTYSPDEKPDNSNVGSNNWAVGGKKTKSGTPILCSDPHLQLQLPSIWYEIQLTSPDVNVYGVSLPGAPCVTIGFNEKVAWGVTNASRDVKDWYRIEWADKNKDSYMWDGKPRKSQKVVEEIKVKGQPTYYDTVVYTHFGPVTYDDNFKQYNNPYPIALRWTALDPSNELKTFYLLNRATNHDDYLKALDYYQCPGQNFVFACSNGDIAIKEQGKFVAKWKEQGKFIMDGTTSAQQWQAFIPSDQNPHILNPESGFVSSANQHPTDATYPYYYNGGFEYYRNQRINQVLATDSNITPEDMMALQNDNMNLLAKQVLPHIIEVLGKLPMQPKQQTALDSLKKWNYSYEASLTAPVIFQLTWDHICSAFWNKINAGDTLSPMPNQFTIAKLLRDYQEMQLSKGAETEEQLIRMSFIGAVDSFSKCNMPWSKYKNTRIRHWAKLEAFDITDVSVGGYKHIVNAADGVNGPSWRMIVQLGARPKAYGIYPGGQSGNPGSPYYADRINQWAAGKYHELIFLRKGEKPTGKYFTETIQPGR